MRKTTRLWLIFAFAATLLFCPTATANTIYVCGDSILCGFTPLYGLDGGGISGSITAGVLPQFTSDPDDVMDGNGAGALLSFNGWQELLALDAASPTGFTSLAPRAGAPAAGSSNSSAQGQGNGAATNGGTGALDATATGSSGSSSRGEGNGTTTNSSTGALAPSYESTSGQSGCSPNCYNSLNGSGTAPLWVGSGTPDAFDFFSSGTGTPDSGCTDSASCGNDYFAANNGRSTVNTNTLPNWLAAGNQNTNCNNATGCGNGSNGTGNSSTGGAGVQALDTGNGSILATPEPAAMTLLGMSFALILASAGLRRLR